MLRPSYNELMTVLNDGKDLDSKVTSRYTIVIAASKRARQIVQGAAPLVSGKSDKAVSLAINEMVHGKVSISVPRRTTDAPEAPA